MKKNESLFSFGKLNKYFIIPFLCPIFCFLANYSIQLYNNEISKSKEKYDIKNKLFLISFSIFFSYLVGGLLYCISYIRTQTEDLKKSKENKKERTGSFASKSSSSSIEYIYNKKTININPLKIFFIFCAMSLILHFALICRFLSINEKVFEKRLYFLLFLPIFSQIILKDELFRHQILSLFISIIGIIFLFIPLILIKQEISILINILIIISSIGHSFFFILIKHLTHKYYLSPYLCLLYIGFFGLIILLIGSIIYYSINNDSDNNYMSIFEGESLESIIYLILVFSFSLILNVLTFLVIFYFSPTLLMITDIINPIISWIISLFIDKEGHTSIEIILNSIGYFLVLFSSLIYNEIIIFNFFGLNGNTKKYLEIKQREELNSIIDDDDEERSEGENDTN